MLPNHERGNLEKRKLELTTDIINRIKWMTPIKIALFVGVPYFAVSYYGHSLTTSDIAGLLFGFCFLDYPLDLYRVWKINQKLRQPRI